MNTYVLISWISSKNDFFGSMIVCWGLTFLFFVFFFFFEWIKRKFAEFFNKAHPLCHSHCSEKNPELYFQKAFRIDRKKNRKQFARNNMPVLYKSRMNTADDTIVLLHGTSLSCHWNGGENTDELSQKSGAETHDDVKSSSCVFVGSSNSSNGTFHCAQLSPDTFICWVYKHRIHSTIRPSILPAS